MNLLQDGFDADFSIENVDGIEFGDIFLMNYHGINVFFYVCGTDTHRVRLFELAKKRKIINGVLAEYLVPGLKPTKAPYFVLEHNSWTKSEFWAETTAEKKIIIPIQILSPIYKKAQEMGIECPLTGDAYVGIIKKEERKQICSYYWPAPKPNKKPNKNIVNISA